MTGKPVEIFLSREKPVCDFCNSSNIAKDYPCEAFDAFKINNVIGASNGGWAACQKCADLIDNDKWDELAAYSFSTLPDKPTEEWKQKVLLGVVKRMHQEFRHKRLKKGETE